MKLIIGKDETYKKLREGIDALADIVGVTLGGKGKNVILNNGTQTVHIINDGVSIAREVAFDEEPAKNTGALLAKKVAEKTNEEAGDGTTTSIVLLQKYLSQLELYKGDITDPRAFREKMKITLDKIVADLEAMKTPVESEDDVERVAFISALDRNMAKAIREVFKLTGKDAVVSIEDAKKPGINWEVVEGVRINDGIMATHLITDNERRVAELSMMPVLVSKKHLNSISDILPAIEELRGKGVSGISIFTEEMSDEVLGFLVANKMAGVFQFIVVKTFDLEDIAVVTGARMITAENNLKFSGENIGLAKKVTAGKSQTTVIGPDNIKDAVEKERATLEKALVNETEDYEKMRIRRRIARLSGGVAVMRIAGDHDQETREMKLKLEDALNATKAAIEEGIIPGGGVALWSIGQKMKREDNTVVENVIIPVLQEPMRRILANAEEDVDKIVDTLLVNPLGTGYNVNTRELENFVEAGVIDPVKVTKSALINAITMGNSIITTEGSIVFTMEKPKE